MPTSKKHGSERSGSQRRGKSEVTFMDLLKQDHEKVRNLFEQIEEDEEGENREKLFNSMESELQAHMQLEENFFYPVLKESEDASEKVLQSLEEHNVAKIVLGECSNLDFQDERWMAKLSVLKELVNHHVQEEEKNVFKMVKQVLEKEQIQQITQQIQEQKSEKKAA